MIKHDSAVLSLFNPVVSLHPKVRERVNQGFIKPILEKFFKGKGRIDSYEELDPDKIQTEIEFEYSQRYVKYYVYKELINSISKNDDGKVSFKPRYVISFDQDLTNFREQNGIKYGELRLGEVPILYFIYIDLQELIRFIKREKENL